MLTRLSIRDFQPHKRKDFQLGRITCFVGTTDAGKSAVIRALRWIAFNRPVGTTFIRWGRKRARTVLWADKQCITRIRGKSQNTYLLNKKKYNAFGNTVPPAIQKLLAIEADNFQLQHDAAFWFTLSPGQVAKELNRVVDLEAIDRTLGSIAATVRHNKATVEVSEERLKDARDKVKSLRWVTSIDRDLQRLEQRESSIIERYEILTRLGSIVDDMTTIEGRIRRAGQGQAGRRKALGVARGIEEKRRAIDAQGERIEKLSNLLNKIEAKENAICHANTSIKKQNRLLEKKLNGRCPTCGGLLTNQIILRTRSS